jgi:tetratricopeptide (TPR) repeat protein
MDLDRMPQENRAMIPLFGVMDDHLLEAVFSAQGPAANLRFMGNCAYDKGQYDAAIDFYNLAIARDHNSVTERAAALANRAQAHLCMGR